jgi:hypothetical protein
MNRQPFFYRNVFFACCDTANVTKATTETELIGIRIAAITGVSMPPTAKYIPPKLYKNEMTKLILTMVILDLVKRMYLLKLWNFDDSSMASQAGEKW